DFPGRWQDTALTASSKLSSLPQSASQSALHQNSTAPKGGFDGHVHAPLCRSDVCAHENGDWFSLSLARGAKTVEHPHTSATSSSIVRHCDCRSDRTHRWHVSDDRALCGMGGVSLQRAHGVRLLDGPWHERPSAHSEYGRVSRAVLLRLLVHLYPRLWHLECGCGKKADLTALSTGAQKNDASEIGPIPLQGSR